MQSTIPNWLSLSRYWVDHVATYAGSRRCRVASAVKGDDASSMQRQDVSNHVDITAALVAVRFPYLHHPHLTTESWCFFRFFRQYAGRSTSRETVKQAMQGSIAHFTHLVLSECSQSCSNSILHRLVVFAGQYEEEQMVLGGLQLQGQGLPLHCLPPLLTQLWPASALPNAQPKPSSPPAACAHIQNSWVQFTLMSLFLLQ